MDVLDAIRQRRSINFFEPGAEVPDDKLTELISLANLSPSSFNVQPWHVVVVKDPGRKKTLRKCAFDQPKVEEASAVLIMVADPKFLEKNFGRVLASWEKLGYIEAPKKNSSWDLARNLYGAIPDDPRRRFTAVKNTALFAMSLMLAAKGLGLETHPMDGFDEAALKKEFAIPEDKLVPMLVAVGHPKPDTTLLPRAFRRKTEEFVKYEYYVE